MKKLFSIIFVGILLFLQIPSSTRAHPQPFVFQEFIFEFKKEEIELNYKFHLDPIVVDNIFPVVDTDNSGNISEAESTKFAEEIVLKNLNVNLNNVNLNFEIKEHKPVYKLDIISIENFIGIDFVVKNPQYKDINSFGVKYNKKFLLDDPFGDLLFFQDNTKDNSDIESIDEDIPVFAEGEYSSKFKFVESSDSTPLPTNINQNSNQTPESGTKSPNFFEKLREKSQQISTNFLSHNKTGLIFVVGGLLIAFVAGSLHAITPGHGKSMMAAFLIGKKKSNFSDILILGSAITFSHTFVIFLLGFIFLGLDKKFSINNILPYFEKFSAFLLILLGLNLVRSSYKNYKHNQKPHSHLDENIKINNKKDLFFAGLGGGIIPCTDAFSFLTYFVGVGKIAYGLIWVFFFSLGLAVAILIIGSVLIYGKVHLSKKSESKMAKIGEIYAPAISGLIILILAINLFL